MAAVGLGEVFSFPNLAVPSNIWGFCHSNWAIKSSSLIRILKDQSINKGSKEVLNSF